MHVAAAVAFNLIFNALGSFLLAAAISALATRCLRAPSGRWRQFFLALPLVKVTWDFARGIPAGSFFWLKVAGERQDLGHFRIGLGFQAPFVPILQFTLGAMKGSVEYPQSAAELASTGLTRRLGPDAPALFVGTAVLVAGLHLAVSVFRTWAADRDAARQRRHGELVARLRCGARAVDVIVADEYEGVPFLGAIRSPYVCFSRATYDSLTPLERDAVIRHELGHLAHGDRLLFAVVNVFADVFWFVPFLRTRCLDVRREAEVCADRWALDHGASAVALASSLLRVAELSRFAAAPVMGLVREPLLSRRIGEILAPRSTAGRSRLGLVVRGCGVAVTVATVLASIAFGNH
jgi:Zn-dependent protease with chaperone function